MKEWRWYKIERRPLGKGSEKKKKNTVRTRIRLVTKFKTIYIRVNLLGFYRWLFSLDKTNLFLLSRHLD